MRQGGNLPLPRAENPSRIEHEIARFRNPHTYILGFGLSPRAPEAHLN